ncbi:MAG TPA: response regulator [Planctomycetia bacterium]|nr:response regulator [Planctomycetia bacterium]
MIHAVCADLIFSSKIDGTARALGGKVRTFPSVARATAGAEPDVKLAILDLGAVKGLEQVAAWKAALPEGCALMAFGSHVDVELLRAARAAGCEPVMARSEFTKRLPELLAAAIAPAEQ